MYLETIKRWIRIKVFRGFRVLLDIFSTDGKREKYYIRKIGNPEYQVFFGYYDITPFSGDNKLLLAQAAQMENITPALESNVELGYYDLQKEEPPFEQFGASSTWCWQQGCRLQWYPENGSQTVLYNRLVDGQYSNIIQNIKSKEIVKQYRKPVYSVSKDGAWGLSLNFSRLQRLRPGYGYANIQDETAGQMAPASDGICRINMKTGEEKFLFSIANIAKFQPLETMAGAEHYFNHILYNPTGTRFMFFHIWMNKGKRFTRIITSDNNGNDLYALVNEGFASHYNWKSSNELIAFSYHSGYGKKYYLYKDQTETRTLFGGNLPDIDGHPSYSPDCRWILSDTYPDRYEERKLICYDTDMEKLETIGKFYSPPTYRGETRCDLHPRWDREGRRIAIDSTHEGKRAIYVIYLDSKLKT